MAERTGGGRMRSSGAERWPGRGGEWLRRGWASVWPILQQTAAAAVAWAIASAVVHFDKPLFAPIAAVVGLNTTLGQRGSNVVRLLLGVIVGILVGELALIVAGSGLWTMTAATFTALVVAQLLGGAPIVRAQAAVAAILITAFGDVSEGPSRLAGALIGGGVALAFSQLVFTPDPLRLLRRAEAAVLTTMADDLRLTADAAERDELVLAEQALTSLRGLRDRLANLDTMRKASGRIVRHSVTRRSKETPVVHERENADQLDLLASSCVTLIRTSAATGPSQRTDLAPGVHRLAQAIADLAVQPGDRATRQRAAEHALDIGRWGVEYSERVPPTQPVMAAAGTAVRMVAFDVMVFAGVEPARAHEALNAGVREIRVADSPEESRPRWPWHRRAAGGQAGQEVV